MIWVKSQLEITPAAGRFQGVHAIGAWTSTSSAMLVGSGIGDPLSFNPSS